jgi:hypothetical protein
LLEAQEKIPHKIGDSKRSHGERRMVFRRSDLQEAFFVPSAQAFRVHGYGTSDPLEEVLAPNYFAAASGTLRPGELIYVSSCPRVRRGGAVQSEPRMALVMVRADERDPERAAGSVRLVQDFGRPGDAPGLPDQAGSAAAGAAPAPVKRGRGRPPGSRTKKPPSAAPAA